MAYTNGDMFLVKYYFDDTTAGIYSSVMVLGKIAMYISAAIIAALFPMVVEKVSRGEDTLHCLYNFFFIRLCGRLCFVLTEVYLLHLC